MTIDRTIYCGNVSAMIDEATIRTLFSHCGEITKVKLAGDTSYNTRFVFVEFVTPEMAHTAVALNGLVLADRTMKISMAKSSITGPTGGGAGGVGGMGGGSYAPRQPQQPQNPDRVARTIFIQGVDQSLVETTLAQFFSVCGPISSVRIAGNFGGTSGRKGWIEFATHEGAYAALMLDGQVLGAHQMRIQPSQSCIQTNGLPHGWRPMGMPGVPPPMPGMPGMPPGGYGMPPPGAPPPGVPPPYTAPPPAAAAAAMPPAPDAPPAAPAADEEPAADDAPAAEAEGAAVEAAEAAAGAEEPGSKRPRSEDGEGGEDGGDKRPRQDGEDAAAAATES